MSFFCKALPFLNCDSTGSSGSLDTHVQQMVEGPVHAVPEPTSVLVYFIALVCLGFWLRGMKGNDPPAERRVDPDRRMF
jgi:hypothetical protein